MSLVLGTIITDCHDGGTRARQEVRFTSLFGATPAFLGVGSYDSVEAAGNLLDQLDVLVNFPVADAQHDAVVLVNVAPRSRDVKEKWDNGTPFCYFRLGRVLVVSTYEGQCLAMARDVGLIDKVELLDLPTVTAAAVAWGDLTLAQAEKINNTQFRSLEFLPLVALWLQQGKRVPSTTQSLQNLPAVTGQAWCVDNFGNVKTTLLPQDVGFEQGKQVWLASGQYATCYKRLADVPTGVTALTIGSSGYGTHRFLEVVIGHQGRAADVHKIDVGSVILAQSGAATPQNDKKQVDSK